MPFTAASIMKRASTILQDADAVRWTAVELRDWLNEAQRSIIIAKPNALSKTITIDLEEGTKQPVPDNVAILSRVMRNVSGSGKAIKTLARREILDNQVPNWHSSDGLPFAADVSMVWQDEMGMREFYVIPGNDGTGQIEAIVGVQPTNVPLPTGDVLDMENYDAELDFDDSYQGILLDLVLYRAFSKDSASPDAANRAQVHLGAAVSQMQAVGNAQAAYSLANHYGSSMMAAPAPAPQQ
ncbi:hypothetical protein BMI86_10285 [Thioclava sp. DLFJ5-1]|uniref:phage adaptor protein n=1 Tax=Thioclava sp. DLFJ5-1 TaxID=1915314 RepID=UPI000997C655|nr:DUF6682 family protein [Thioclava sp. DLFJ5-1]OOY20885.1 hypothetical protein BMI86_10285 [Thioclava sp. DLFJ5-1]